MAYAARVVIPKHRKELKGLPLAVYYALCDTANDETMVAYPSVYRLAQQVDCDTRKVSDATKVLKHLGLIRITHKNNTNNRYSVNVPDWFNESRQFHFATESRVDGFDAVTGGSIPAEEYGERLIW